MRLKPSAPLIDDVAVVTNSSVEIRFENDARKKELKKNRQLEQESSALPATQMSDVLMTKPSNGAISSEKSI